MKRPRSESLFGNECIICTNEIKKKDLVVLECCHMYHSDCIIKLVEKRSRKCPICRTRIRWNVKQLNRHIELFK